MDDSLPIFIFSIIIGFIFVFLGAMFGTMSDGSFNPTLLLIGILWVIVSIIASVIVASLNHR